SDGLFLIADLKAGHRNIRLVAILLPKKPFRHLRPAKGIRRNQARSLRKIENDGVRLRERAVFVEPYNRDLPGRVHGQEIGTSALTLEDIDLNPLVGNLKEVGRPFYFQAIPRDRISKYLHHHYSAPPPRSVLREPSARLGQFNPRLARAGHADKL